MAKYEIMVLVSGKLTQPEADHVHNELLKHIKVPDLTSKHWGTHELAYPIRGEHTAHYYLINFDGGPQSFFEWRRLTLINKSVLRHLVINLEKDYAWRVSQNAKKVKRAETQQAKYDEIVNNPDYVPTRKPLPPPYKPKKRDEWTIVKKIGPNGPEDISQYFKKRTTRTNRERPAADATQRRESSVPSVPVEVPEAFSPERPRRSAATRKNAATPRRDSTTRRANNNYRDRYDEGDE